MFRAKENLYRGLSWEKCDDWNLHKQWCEKQRQIKKNKFHYYLQPTDKSLKLAVTFLKELSCFNVNTFLRAEGNLRLTLSWTSGSKSLLEHKKFIWKLPLSLLPKYTLAIILEVYDPLIYIWRVSWLKFYQTVINDVFLKIARPLKILETLLPKLLKHLGYP